MGARDEWRWIVPAALWETARPLLPPDRVRPQGGGTRNAPDETVFAAVVYVLVSGCAWRALPPCFALSKSTAHRRFLIWSRAGVWERLHHAVLDRRDAAGLRHLSRTVLRAARERAKEGANLQARAPWHGVERAPRCAPCPVGKSCPSHRS